MGNRAGFERLANAMLFQLDPNVRGQGSAPVDDDPPPPSSGERSSLPRFPLADSIAKLFVGKKKKRAESNLPKVTTPPPRRSEPISGVKLIDEDDRASRGPTQWGGVWGGAPSRESSLADVDALITAAATPKRRTPLPKLRWRKTPMPPPESFPKNAASVLAPRKKPPPLPRLAAQNDNEVIQDLGPSLISTSVATMTLREGAKQPTSRATWVFLTIIALTVVAMAIVGLVMLVPASQWALLQG